MAKRFYTILILPDATAKARRLHIPRSVLAAFAWVLGFFLLLSFFSVYQYVSLHSHILELKRLRREVGERHLFQERLQKIERELLALRGLDWKLREAVGLKVEEPLPGGRGVAEGGSGALLDVMEAKGGALIEAMQQDLEQLNREVSAREESLQELKAFFEEKRSLLASTPTIWPAKGWLSAGYGYRRSPFTGRREMHEGLDIAAPIGTPIRATADGKVAFSGRLGGFGRAVLIHHGHGFSTFYAHNSRNVVKEGQRVRRGDVIAYVGNTGRSTGPHVHYEVHVKGRPVNPSKYIMDFEMTRYAEREDPTG